MLLMLVIFAVFGVPVIILHHKDQRNEIEIGDYSISTWLLDMFVREYFITLFGHFNADDLGDGTTQTAAMCYAFFIGQTFLAQIMMLNLIIAIMGDTYDKMVESKHIDETKTKLKLISECISDGGKLTKDETKQDTDQTASQQDEDYMFIVQPDEDNHGDHLDIDDTTWEGSLNRLSATIAKNNGFVKKNMTECTHKVQKQITKFQESQI